MRLFSQLFATAILSGLFSLVSYSQEYSKTKKESPDARQASSDVSVLNMNDKADAYPFISADGLRLYFTSDREGGFGRLYISTRKSVNEAFGKPSALDKKLTDGYYAGTLTADELTIYMTKQGGTIHVAHRISIDAPFSEPVPVKGIVGNYNFGPGISPDGNELYVVRWHSEENTSAKRNDRIVMYKKISYDHFEKTDELPVPVSENKDGYLDFGPGQFSKDGLYFYFSLENSPKEEYIWRYHRQHTGDKFVDLEKISLSMNKDSKQNSQPTVNGDGSIIVYITSPLQTWEDDDLAIEIDPVKRIFAPEQFRSVSKNEKETLLVKSKVELLSTKTYPNPFQNSIVFEMAELPADKLVFFLYDMSGKVLKQESINATKTTISLQQMIAGTYLYQVMDSQKRIVTSGKLIKQ